MRRDGLQRYGSGASRKHICYALLMLLVALVVVEISARVMLVVKLGPRTALYGTRYYRNERMVDKMEALNNSHTVMWHENMRGAYSKYFPGEVKTDTDQHGGLFKVTMNKHGFRGKSHAIAKGPGDVRIVTLGGSSTFGYGNRDNETYPQVMEDLLNKSGAGARYEVINLGIPHMRSDNIRSLFYAEALVLKPDIVTYYEGMNDTVSMTGVRGAIVDVAVKGTKENPLLKRLVDVYAVLRDKSVLVLLLENVMITFEGRLFTDSDLKDQLDGKSATFITNLSEIKSECARRGILFVVANQQAKSLAYNDEEIKGLTYHEEVDRIAIKLQEKGVTVWEMRFLVHASLMETLRKWADKENIPFVDVIEAMDNDRDCLTSWVHLNPKGNRIIARALAGKILEVTAASGKERSRRRMALAFDNMVTPRRAKVK